MKNLIVRTAFALTLLLALGAIFGGTNSVSAHAATIPAASSAHAATLSGPSAIKPYDPYQVGCSGDVLEIGLDWGYNGFACYAGTGSINVNLTTATSVCAGSHAAYVVYYTTYYVTVYIPSGQCSTFPGASSETIDQIVIV